MSLLITNARIVTCNPDVEVARDADCVMFEAGKIAFIGMKEDAPATDRVVDVDGRVVTPGLVDSHTHLVWAGDRLGDFLRRAGGVSYSEMQTGDGGILSTVRATAAAGVDVLTATAAERLKWLASSGATTVEVKSGYGIDSGAELRMLAAAEHAGRKAGLRVETTLLGAHAIPTVRSREAQIDAVVTEMIPAVAENRLAKAVDVFADSIAYTAEEMARIFSVAAAHDLGVKAHVGQIADVGAARIAAEFGAMSIDHCEHVPESAMEALAAAETAVVLVPGASFYLGDDACPPVDAMRRHGLTMAVATDLNPGSSPLASLPTAASLAIHRFGLTPQEALLGITSAAADALRLGDGRGRIEVGGVGDLAVWNVNDPLEIVYWINAPMCAGVVVGGQIREYQPW